LYDGAVKELLSHYSQLESNKAKEKINKLIAKLEKSELKGSNYFFAKYMLLYIDKDYLGVLKELSEVYKFNMNSWAKDAKIEFETSANIKCYASIACLYYRIHKDIVFNSDSNESRSNSLQELKRIIKNEQMLFFIGAGSSELYMGLKTAEELKSEVQDLG
jgi:hypothetical protein